MINEKINKSFLNISSPPFIYRNLAITQLIKYSNIIISKMRPQHNIYLVVFKSLFKTIVINNIYDILLLEISYNLFLLFWNKLFLRTNRDQRITNFHNPFFLFCAINCANVSFFIIFYAFFF